MVARQEKERRINRKENRRFWIGTSIAMAFLIATAYSLYQSQCHSDKMLDIEGRLNKLENRISKSNCCMMKVSDEMKYIDSNICDTQKEKTDTLK